MFARILKSQIPLHHSTMQTILPRSSFHHHGFKCFNHAGRNCICFLIYLFSFPAKLTFVQFGKFLCQYCLNPYTSNEWILIFFRLFMSSVCSLMTIVQGKALFQWEFKSGNKKPYPILEFNLNEPLTAHMESNPRQFHHRRTVLEGRKFWWWAVGIQAWKFA